SGTAMPGGSWGSLTARSPSGARHQVHQAVDDLVAIDAVGLRLEAEDQAVAQHVVDHPAHVVRGDEIPPREPGQGAAAAVEGDGGPGAGAVVEPVLEILAVAPRV